MPANIEIKARVTDLAPIRAAIEPLADGPAHVLDQEDIFFAAPDGRLKLRTFADGNGELIHYHRSDIAGPKTSHYTIAPTSDPDALRAILTSALGVLGVVRKRRWLYMVGQTRVHLDRVEGLGDSSSWRSPSSRPGRGRGGRHRPGLDGPAGDRRGSAGRCGLH